MTERILLRKILTTPNFFQVFAKHLDKLFTTGWIYDIEEVNDVICAVCSTMGWSMALHLTCVELDITEVYEYWSELEWDESDMLDGQIGELLCAVVYDENNQRVNN